MKTNHFDQFDVIAMTNQEMVDTLGGTNPTPPSHHCNSCYDSSSSRKSTSFGLNLDLDLNLNFESSRSSRSWSC